MKRKRCPIAISIVFTLLFALAGDAEARKINMLFWYPGEAGTTEEAQPVLDVFCDYLNKKIAPDTIDGRYFNGVSEGSVYIKQKSPLVGIISFAAWVQNRNKLAGAVPWLATLPLPHGKSEEHYVLIGRTKAIEPNAQILSSEPMSISFVREYLFPDMAASARLRGTDQMLYNLRKIGEGVLKAGAILTPTEAAALARLTSPWAKAIKVIARSKPVPTARVVLFDSKWRGAARLEEVLLSAGGDPGCKEILGELRLKGFAKR